MMKKSTIFLLLMLPLALLSQGKHYIIPDIGAPDMAVYVEMIAPHDQKGYFGDDGLYLGNPADDVLIQITKNAQYVTFGPYVVSWDGRMISTHIFVDETANPTSVTADPAFQVEFDVTGPSVISPRSFVFNIVKPQSLGNNGDISGINETILGQGNLGFRSERGAMIVDSLTFKPNTTYTVSTNDPDGDISNGNQGYFPAIILSKGPIRGNGAKIDVSAKSKHAGPGGGGGGGRFIDAAIGTPEGSDGGDGYTGGGKGGRNGSSSPLSSDNYRDIGKGTGGRGISWNGIPIDDPSSGYEASYGGTGHPFGSSGFQSISGGDANNPGGYGGGSGWRNNQKGGAGGYNREGDGDGVSNGTTGGRIHGNEMIVPFAGGSGGAGGNPLLGEATNGGEGGGGGGAINLYGESIIGIDIIADGDDGRDGSGNANGGPGSGGAASIMAKTDLTNITLSADGGTRSGRNGGAGRIRYDGWTENNDPVLNPAAASNYRGISTDTANTIKPRHRLSGTHQPGKRIIIYQKSPTSRWIPQSNFGSGFPSWGQTLNFDQNHEDKYYIVAIQDMESQTGGDYTYAPRYVLSQAATNIIRFGEPDIYCPKDTSYDYVSCGSGAYVDSIQIQSTGGDFLNLQVTDNWVFGDRGFKVLNPFDGVVSPNSPDSLFYIQFEFQAAPGQTGTFTDTLLVAHNALGKDTCRIAVSVNVTEYSITILDGAGQNEIDTLDLGTICIGEKASGKFTLKNTSLIDFSEINLKIETNGSTEAKDFSVFPVNLGQLAINESKVIDASFEDEDNNSFPNGVIGKVLIFTKQCPDPIDTLYLFVKVIKSELTLSEADLQMDFGAVNITSFKDMTVTVTNTGDAPALIQYPTNSNPAFVLTSPTAGTFPVLLQPVSVDPTAKLDLTYRFSPTAEIDYLDSTNYISIFSSAQNACPSEVKMYLSGSGTTSEITFKDTLDFGILYECEVDSVKDIFIKNESGVVVTIDTTNSKLLGDDSDYFKVLAKPYTISANGQNNFLVGFVPPNIPATAGVRHARIEFDLLPPTGEIKIIHLKAEIDTFLVEYQPNPFDMGQIPVGIDSPPQQLTLTNNGKLPRKVIGFDKPPTSKLTITHTNGFPVVIPAGGSEVFDVDIDLLQEDLGDYSETIIAQFEKCDNELVINVEAEGVEGKLSIITREDLGDSPPCLNIIDEPIEFRNVGQADIRLDSVIILDNQRNEISRVNIAPIIMEEYDGTNAILETYTITKLGLPFGLDTTIIVAYVFENGIARQYEKIVTANIVSGIIITPNPVDFGSVFQNNTSSISVTFAKDPNVSFSATSAFDINIDNVNLDPPYLEYTFMPPNFFRLDDANPSQTVEFQFEAPDAQNYDAVLNVSINMNGCPYSVPLQLLASGSAGDSVRIFTKDYNDIEPNIDNFRIAIYGQLATFDKTVDKVVEVQIAQLDIDFEKTMFFPMELTNGTFLSRTTDGDLSRISIAMDSPVQINNKQEVILTELIGPTMLGTKKQTLIHLNSTPTLFDETGISNITATGSYLNMTVCQEGGDRLLEHTDGFDYTLFKTVSDLNINANLIEPGLHSIKLFNSTGSSETIATIERNKDDRTDFELSYNIEHLSSGVYYIVFETPARYKTQKLIIIR